jgi:putative endonuclease
VTDQREFAAMTVGRRQLGVDGERAAERFLRRRGYTIVARNYRCRVGEIDLIALDGNSVVFVEVKTLSGAVFGAPHDAVGVRKQRQLGRVAEHYLAAQRLEDRDVRFDVVSVAQRGDELVCELIRDAFDPAEPNDW